MIFKQFAILLSITITMIGCGKMSGPKKPHDLISKEKMVAILIDAKLITSASFTNKNIMKRNGIEVNHYIFEKYQIDSLQFALSNNYYAFHIKDYEAILNKVTDSFEALKTTYKTLEAQEWKEKTQQEEDSLKVVLKNKKQP